MVLCSKLGNSGINLVRKEGISFCSVENLGVEGACGCPEVSWLYGLGQKRYVG